MDLYADRTGIGEWEYDGFLDLMEGLDQVFLSETAAKGKKKK